MAPQGPWLTLAGLLLWIAPDAHTDVVYQYAGMPFTAVNGSYTTDDFLSGTIQLSSVLPPDSSVSLGPATMPIALVAWSFSDGLKTLTPANSNVFIGAMVVTDPSGGIVQWSFDFFDPQSINDMSTNDHGPGDQIDQATDLAGMSVSQASNQNAPGTWTLVPEPSSDALSALSLFVVGLLAGASRSASGPRSPIMHVEPDTEE